MNQELQKPSLLFVGASGPVANKVLPELSKHFNIVGISRSRTELATYCTKHILGNLLVSHEELFRDAFATHTYHTVIWNAVAFFPSLIKDASRETLHTEFDLAVALPVSCVQFYLKQKTSTQKHFIGVSSKSAYGDIAPRASYSMIKRAQLETLLRLVPECPDIHFSIIAPERVSHISDLKLLHAFIDATKSVKSGHVYVVDEDSPLPLTTTVR